MVNINLIFYIIVGVLVLVPLGLYLFKRKTFKKAQKKVGTIGQGLVVVGLIVICISPMNPALNGWLWEGFGGDIDPSNTGNHLDFNDETVWSGLDVTGTIFNGLDDVDYTNVGTMVWAIYTSLDPTGYITGGSTANGVFTTAVDAFTSGDIVYLVGGTVDDDETANVPEKTQIWTAVIQGRNGDSHPGTVALGTGRFMYYYLADEDTDLTITLLDDSLTAFASSNLDQGAASGNIVDSVLRVAFTDVDACIRSYSDSRMLEDAFDFYVVIKLTKANDTLYDGVVITVPGYTVQTGSIYDGRAWVFKLTPEKIHTDNTRPTGLYYDDDAGGTVKTEYKQNWYFDIRFDFSGTGLVSDDADAFVLSIELGSSNSMSSVLASGDLVEGALDAYDGITWGGWVVA